MEYAFSRRDFQMVQRDWLEHRVLNGVVIGLKNWKCKTVVVNLGLRLDLLNRRVRCGKIEDISDYTHLKPFLY